MNAKYIGKQLKFLIPSNTYTIKFTKPKGYHVYNCNVLYDITNQEEIDELINYSSEISIKNNWEINGNILDKD